MTRIEARFAQLKAENRKAFVAFITAGDPDIAVSTEILTRLPEAGADIIELGMPFTDPMADGPSIQAASQRALKAGQSVRGTLDMVRQFRATNDTTPIVLMGHLHVNARLVCSCASRAVSRATCGPGAEAAACSSHYSAERGRGGCLTEMQDKKDLLD